MQTTIFASVLALLVALAVPGFYALPVAPTVDNDDVGPQIETALDAVSELTDVNLPQQGRARRAISSVDNNDVGPQPMTALDTVSELADVDLDLPQKGRARRVISSTNCVDYIYIMAQTSGQSGGGSDGEHDVEIRAQGQTHSAQLSDHFPGNQYESHKGDLWKLNLNSDLHFSGCIHKGDIEYIAIEESHTDGWVIDSIITILRDDYAGSKYYEVATVDMDVNRWVDGDRDWTSRRFELSLVI